MDLIDPFAQATPRLATRLKSGEPHQVFSGFLFHVGADRYIILTALHCLLRPNTFYFKNRGTEGTWAETYAYDLDCAALGISVPLYDGRTPRFRWHQDPDNAPSDGPNMVHLKDMEGLLKNLMAFDRLAKAA